MSGNGKRKGAAPAAPRAGSAVSQPSGSDTPFKTAPVGTRLIGYCRVSTTDQADNGVSLEEQENRIHQYAKTHGLQIVGVEVDAGASGKHMARDALQRALCALRGGDADGLVAIKLDRLSRSVRDVLDLVDRSDREGWQLHCIAERLDTSSAIGRFTVHLLGALAQLEREQISERTKAALSELRRQGRRISGKPPLGYCFRDGLLVEVEAEQQALRVLTALRAEGCGARSIARRMNMDGAHNPRTGRFWSPSTVAKILRRLEADL